MDDSEIDDQAYRHDEARRTANQIEPVTVEHPQLTIEDAYAIQNRWLEIELALYSLNAQWTLLRELN